MDKKKSFIFGTAVSDYNFIGREKETQRLMANFTEGINSIGQACKKNA